MYVCLLCAKMHASLIGKFLNLCLQVKTIMHAFFQCSHSVNIWRLIKWYYGLGHTSI